MRSMTEFLLLVCFGLVLVQLIQAQNCVPPPKREGDDFPDIWKLSKNSYQLYFEANYGPESTTRFVKETYDKTNQRGRLDVEIAGEEHRIVYFGKTDEIFMATRYSCEGTLVSTVDESRFASKYGGWNWINKDKSEIIVGPSNMFRRALKEWNTPGSTIGKESTTETVRGMRTNVWTWCYNKDNNQVVNKFYFTDPKEENPYGLDGAIPVRVTAEGTWNGRPVGVSFEYIGMKLDLQDLDNIISIPVSVGCLRGAANLPKAKDYSGSDIYVEAELVYTPFIDNSPGYTYITNYKIAVDAKSKVSSIQYSPWKSHKDADMAEPGDELYKVTDSTNGFEFNIDNTLGTCVASGSKDFFTMITLPDGAKIDLGNSDIFPIISRTSSFVYMQDTTERGLPASIFEKRVDTIDDNGLLVNQLIVTRYQVANGTKLSNQFNEENAPLKVTYWMINLDPTTTSFSGRLAVNFHSFRSALKRKHEVFDVSDCFADRSQYQWVQLAFPLGNATREQVYPFFPSVLNDYPSVLEHFSVLLVPYRIPKILVDADNLNIYVTALIIDRPDYLLDFEKLESTNLKSTVQQTRFGMTSLKNCARNCIDQDSCTTFTYCGNVCSTTTSTVAIDLDTEPSFGCTLYQNQMLRNSPTIERVAVDIKKAVETKQIKLLFSVPPVVLDFTANRFQILPADSEP